MPLMKTRRATDGYNEVSDPVRFLSAVQLGLGSPWGTTYFVDGLNGADTNSGTGTSSSLAKKTIQSAVTAAGRGDIIYIRPQDYVVGSGFRRYVEDVTVSLAKSDLSIIGISNSPNPEYGVRWKHSSAYNLINDGPALHLENIGFFSEGATGTALLRNDAGTDLKRGTDGTTFYNCVIKGGYVYITSGGDGTTFKKCIFHCNYNGVVAGVYANGAAGGLAGIRAGRRLRILDCHFQDGNGIKPSAPMIVIVPTFTEILIDRSTFGLLPAGDVYISAANNGSEYNSGLISNCCFSVAELDTNLHILPGSMIVSGCFDGAGVATTA